MDEYIIRVGSRLPRDERKKRSESSYDHEVTYFMRTVKALVINELPPEFRPDRSNLIARKSRRNFRYYGFYYSRGPWKKGRGQGTNYEILLFPQKLGRWKADVWFKHDRRAGQVNFEFHDILDGISYPNEWKIANNPDRIVVEAGSGTLDDDAFAGKIADVLRKLIETITPVVDALANGSASAG